MIRHEVRANGITGEEIVAEVETLQLEIKEMRLRTMPTSRHWHIRQKGASGTLEITWNPPDHLIIEARSNRYGIWQPDVAKLLVNRLSSRSADRAVDRTGH